MYYFCTYFDQNYLPRGLALYRSLQKHCPEFKLWVICMDDATNEALIQLDLPEVESIALRDFERDDKPLLQAKQNRSQVEYYFTCTPSLPLYVLNHWPTVDLITYLDADLFFFANPAPIFEEMGNASIAMIGHRFPPHLRHKEQFGIYNVGWLSFKRDETAFNCLQLWRDRCIDWCYDRIDRGRFADQKYLDDWPRLFRNIVVLEHKGANLAPWNVANYHLNFLNWNTVMVDNQPLIFFHFHGLKKVRSWLYNPGWIEYNVRPAMVIRRRIYAPYIQTLFNINRQLLQILDSDLISDDVRIGRPQAGTALMQDKCLTRRIRTLFYLPRDIMTGKYLYFLNRYVI